jgi:MinD-like ATPase involved in chromosome partitioning or flagellar assembly
MEYYFTWHDIEDIFEENRNTWPKTWVDVQVYSDSVEIYQNGDEPQVSDIQYLKEIFGRNYSTENNTLRIDFTGIYLEVTFLYDDSQKVEKKYGPLFRDIYFQKCENTDSDFDGVKMIAFHSYKGGVGRTLSLTAFLRQCTEKYPDKKILVLDADVEAPGLTWMAEAGYRRISYLDILSIMNYEQITDQMLEKLCDLVKTSTVSVSTDQKIIDQYFIPVYREKEQNMNVGSKPEQVLMTQENKFYITETIAKMAGKLGVNLVLIDLRAGITEYSAPFLFDPRVIKYYVTSTSLQSVKGTNQILEQVYKKTNADFLKSRIVLTMIPETMKTEEIQEIESQIVEEVESGADTDNATFLRDEYFMELGFDKTFVRTTDFNSLCEKLKGSELASLMDKQMKSLFMDEQKDETIFADEGKAREILKRIYEISYAETTAEGTSSANMLVTSSIKEMVKNFKMELPRIVVSGAKGSGKTYIYKQLLQAKTWESFIEQTGTSLDVEHETIIIPLLASINTRNMQPLIVDCMKYADQKLPEMRLKKNVDTINYNMLMGLLESSEMSRMEWVKQWFDLIIGMFLEYYKDISELDEALQRSGKRIIFIVDGLEDVCADSQTEKNDRWKNLLKALCQNVVNDLQRLDHGNIGMVVFARKDMINNAIDTNMEQFRSMYYNYELNWTQTEALRLALWIASKAYPDLTDGIDVLNATRSVLTEKLTTLWGLKLGKRDSREAFSDRWILAALSDFTGQLQARDIVRFLRYSTEGYGEAKLIYKDRLIMPVEIRNAIGSCAADKYKEIKAEMRNIYEILEKFEKMEGVKTLPLTLDKIQLTGDEISKLEAQGYLKISDEKYYLPEIIRLPLGFTYERGARPKVLSLLVQ